MAAKTDLPIDQGTKKSFRVQYKNGDGSIFNLTGYSAKMQARKSYTSDVLIELVSPTDIDISIPLGQLTLNFLPAHTSVLSKSKQSLLYDLEITNGVSNVLRVIEGSINISPEVTI